MKRTFLWAMVIMAVISTACASGGGGTNMPVEEVRELLTAYAGQWELDQSSAPSQRARLEPPPTISVEGSNRASVRAQARREAEAAQRLMAIQQETFRIFNFYPRTLVLQVDGDSLAYRPTPGPSSMLPLDGRSITRSGTERNVSTRINWDVQRLEFTHQVESTGRVSEVFELVGDRLRVTRTVRVRGQRASPFVLMYDRQQEQEPEDESAGAGVEAGQEVKDEDEDEEVDRFRLYANCREIVPVVILEPDSLYLEDLTESDLEEAVDINLRSLPTFSRHGTAIGRRPLLYVTVGVIGWSFTVRVEMMKWVVDPVHELEGLATTWRTVRHGVHRGDKSFVVSSLDTALQVFMDEYRRVNGSVCPPAGGSSG